MKIEKVLVCQCLAGYFNKDLLAIKAGAMPDGFAYRTPPITPGFKAVTQPGEALSVMLILSDHQVAVGDCTDVVFAGAAGRDPVFRASEHRETVERQIAAFLVGKPIRQFRQLAESVDTMEVSGKRLHAAVRYGVTQALLDGAAKANHLTMAEIIAAEYGCAVADQPVPLVACTPNEQRLNIDKMILKRVPYLPHGSSSNMERDIGLKGEKLLAYIEWLTQRIHSLREPDYYPTVHLDVYGTIGEAFKLDIHRIADYIGKMNDSCSPYPLIVETPIIAETVEGQISLLQELLAALKRKSVPVKIIADEWCNTLEDIRNFADARAADILQIKTPDLGGITNSIEAIFACKERGVGAYIAGSTNGTDQSAKILVHVALATRADLLAVVPGQGVDEGLMIEYNEMQRTLTLIRNQRNN